MIRQDFYDQLNVSEVGREYLTLVSECKDRALIPEKGYEIHHIQPTSLGGLNTEDNKVKFTIFEHCKAHALLAQAIPCYKTLQPLTRMSCGQVTKLEDAEKINLDEVYNWSKLREKALHHPKSPELIEKNRLGHLGKRFSPEHIAKRTARRVGTVTVTNGTITKYIHLNELEQWEARGWKRGISEERRKNLQESHKGKTGTLSATTGRKCINKDGKELKVKTSDLDQYIRDGWKLGRDPSFVDKRNKSMEGKTNVGKVRVNRDGIGKLVSKDLLDSYLEQGWKLGLARHN